MLNVQVGDELVIDGHRVGEPPRKGHVVEVRGEGGAPPYRVKWDDSGRTTLLFPGPDCHVHHVGNDSATAGAG